MSLADHSRHIILGYTELDRMLLNNPENTSQYCQQMIENKSKSDDETSDQLLRSFATHDTALWQSGQRNRCPNRGDCKGTITALVRRETSSQF